MKKIYGPVSVLILSLLSLSSSAQTKFSFTGGVGLAYVASKNINANYTPFITPHFEAEVAIPIFKNGIFETGLDYVKKGYGSFSKIVDEEKVMKFYGRRRYQYLTIPLTLSYCVYKTKRAKIWAGGGMNYGFYLKGSASYNSYTYEYGQLISKENISYPVKGIWAKSGIFSGADDKNDIYKLDVMARLQCRYVLEDRYIIGLFYDHSLYDNNINALNGAGSSLKLRYVGLSVGITL